MLITYNKRGDKVDADRIIKSGALEAVQQLPDGSIGAVITDPPFFTGVGRDDGGFGSDPWEGISSLHGAADWATPMMEQLTRVVRPGGAIAVMCGVHASAAWMLAAENAGLKWMAELMVLWNTGKPRSKNFGSLHTHIQWFTRPGARHTWNSHRKSFFSNILIARKIPIQQRVHISQKPIELTNFLVSLLSRPNDVILDPFCGSGSTLISAEMCDRYYIGIDKDANNVKISNKRLSHIELEETHELHFWINGRSEEI